jgi:hypothetical protein
MRFRKRSKKSARWAEDTHMMIAVFCTIAVIAGLFLSLVWLFPAESRAKDAVRVHTNSYGTAR